MPGIMLAGGSKKMAGGGGGITLIADTISQGNSSGTTSGAINTTGANFIVVGVNSYKDATEPTLSDSKGNTWIPLTERQSGIMRTRLYYCESPTVGSGHTFDASGALSFVSIGVAAFSGVDSSSFDSENTGNVGNGTSTNTGSVTPGSDGALLVAVLNCSLPGVPDSCGIDSSFTLLDSSGNISGQSFGIGWAYYVQPTAGTVNPSFSWTTTSPGLAAIAAFNAA